MADVAAPAQFNPFDPAFHEDPYPVLNELRERDPLHRMPMGIVMVTRHEDVWRVLRHRDSGRDFPMWMTEMSFGDGSMTQSFTRNLLNREGPDHTRLRKLMAVPFVPGRIRDLRPRVKELVDDLLDDTGDEFDMVTDFGGVLPVLVICELLGLPSEDRELVRPWAHALADATGLFPSSEVLAAANAATDGFHDYFEDLLAGRRRYEPDGLFAALVAVEEDGERLGHDELVDNALLLFFAGFETTTNLIGNGVLALMRFPDQWDRLQQESTLAATAVDELLRFDSPLQTSIRLTHEPIELSGGTVKADRVLQLSIAAANRDPRVFAAPDTLDVGRADNPHLAFGSGAHFCLGAHLARLEGELAFAGLVERFAQIEQAGDYVRKASSGLRGLDSMPVRVTRH